MANDIRSPDRPSSPTSTVRPRFRFAPVSGNSHSWIDVAAGYFWLNGAVCVMVLLASIGAVVLGKTRFTIAEGFSIAMFGVFAVGQFWVGKLIAQREKTGGWFALILVLLSIFSGEPLRAEAIILAVVSLIVLKTIWRDLE